MKYFTVLFVVLGIFFMITPAQASEFVHLPDVSSSQLGVRRLQYQADTSFIRTLVQVQNKGNELKNIDVMVAWVNKFDKVYAFDRKSIARLKIGESKNMEFHSMIPNWDIQNAPSKLSNSIMVMIGSELVELKSIVVVSYDGKTYKKTR
ncbi:MAG: hypothetical protein ACLFQV_06805 [Vulcanimicrobiota bacterium]